MQALIQKKYGRDATSLFNLDEFLGYCFPPVKDWLIICIELLCTYTCTQLLGDYVQGGASAMHILIKETWNALGTAPNSLNPHFVLNHIDQVCTAHPRALCNNSAPLGGWGWGGWGGGLAQGLGIRLFAFGGAHWPLATAHIDPLWVRTCFGGVNGTPG